MFGQSNTCRSFLTLELALCTAAGVEFFGISVGQGAVVWVAGEGRGGLARRIEVRCLHQDVNVVDLPCYITATAVPMINQLAFAKLCGRICSTMNDVAAPIVLVIIDTMAPILMQAMRTLHRMPWHSSAP
ncbi:MAG: AAA family ATPase [Pseudomonadota bacterium]|nr:MAG: AAA family ATPase [Pseudomonadota bacterium]